MRVLWRTQPCVDRRRNASGALLVVATIVQLELRLVACVAAVERRKGGGGACAQSHIHTHTNTHTRSQRRHLGAPDAAVSIGVLLVWIAQAVGVRALTAGKIGTVLESRIVGVLSSAAEEAYADGTSVGGEKVAAL